MAILPGKQLGERQDVSVRAVNASSTPVAPTNNPNYAIYNNSGSKVASGKIPAKDAQRLTGWFQKALFLDSSFAAGSYSMLIDWITGGNHQSTIHTFEVLAGGDADGPVQGMTYFRRPEVKHVVYQTESGKLQDGHNPR